MADLADSVPVPANPSNKQPYEVMKIQAILGRENYVNGLHYSTVEVKIPPGNIIQEPLDETVEESPNLAEDRNKYFSERERLKTYEKWTDSYPVLPQHLAKNGFIHTGPGDKVMCVFCFNVISQWEPGDNVQGEHKRLYPECPFVKGLCNHINKPIVSQRNLRQNLNVHLNELNPRVPAFMDEVTRFETFEFWPSTNNQHPKTLAAAGFFYKPQPGKPDRVRCFMCGKYLHRWEPDDDAWREHARISPRCKFVINVKGQEFVDMCSAPREAYGDKKNKMETLGLVPQTVKMHVSSKMDLSDQYEVSDILAAKLKNNLPTMASAGPYEAPASVTPEPMEITPSPNPSLPSDLKPSEEDPSKHIAVQAVLQNFGSDYTEEQVIKAFQKLSLVKGKDTTVTAKHLLEKLFEEED